MSLSRRVFLSWAGLIPLFGWSPVTPVAARGAAERLDDLIVVKGWVLTRDDLEHLASA
jgi:hypothetical protein